LPVKLLVLALAIALPGVPAAQDAMAPVKLMVGTKGVCSRLVVGSVPTPCGDAALNIVYRDGQTSIMIKTADRNLVSFFGRPYAQGGIAVIKVTMTHNGQTPKVSSTPATGRCSAASLKVPKTHVECVADAPDGKHYEAAFTGTDDDVMVSDLDR
jgi:hypothetical protein